MWHTTTNLLSSFTLSLRMKFLYVGVYKYCVAFFVFQGWWRLQNVLDILKENFLWMCLLIDSKFHDTLSSDNITLINNSSSLFLYILCCFDVCIITFKRCRWTLTSKLRVLFIGEVGSRFVVIVDSSRPCTFKSHVLKATTIFVYFFYRIYCFVVTQ